MDVGKHVQDAGEVAGLEEESGPELIDRKLTKRRSASCIFEDGPARVALVVDKGIFCNEQSDKFESATSSRTFVS